MHTASLALNCHNIIIINFFYYYCLCCHSGKCVHCSCVLSSKNCHNCLPSHSDSCSNTFPDSNDYSSSEACLDSFNSLFQVILGFPISLWRAGILILLTTWPPSLQIYWSSDLFNLLATYYFLPSGLPLCC